MAHEDTPTIVQPPPVARVEPVREILFGATIDDPYRWMEDWKGEEARQWVAAQGAYARAYLDALPERAALLARISALSDAGSTLSNLQVSAGRVFYLVRGPDDNVGKLAVRTASDASERVLFDPNTLAGAGEAHTAIDWYTPSRDGRLVAYGSSQGGSEESTLRVLEVETGVHLDEAITRCRFGGVSWLPDNRAFVYHRLADYRDGTPETERYFDSVTHLHRLGADPEGDPVVFARGLAPGVAIDREDWPIVEITPNGAWMVGLVIHGVLNELTLYAAPISGLSAPASCPWVRLADTEDGVVGYAADRDDTVYLRTHRDAPRYKVVAISLRAPDLAHAAVVTPEGERVIEDIKVAGDYLVTRDLDGGIGRLRRIPLGGGPAEDIPLPIVGTISAFAGEASSPELTLQLTNWTTAPRVYRLDAPTGALHETDWAPSSPVDFGEIEAHEVFATARDGARIPLSIVHKRGITLDSANPTLLSGYGSYGLIPYTPSFSPTMLAWFERGGVFAAAHIRGGGEHGTEWHEAGRKLTKENTITDLIDCAEYLIAQGYTSPRYIAGEGTSAGGIPSGGALVRRPDLWAAMVMRVAVTNALRSEFSENGPPNVPEFGSVSTEEGFRGLRIMDAYTRVQDGVPYPAVLLTTGLNDPRVVVWQAAKMAARLQAATSSGRPVLLRVEAQGGHGMGSTKRQNDEELADKLAFLLHAMGQN